MAGLDYINNKSIHQVLNNAIMNIVNHTKEKYLHKTYEELLKILWKIQTEIKRH